MILRQVVQRPVTPLATRLSNSCTKSTAWHVAFHCLAALTRPAKCSLHCPGCYGIHQDPWFEIMCGWCFQMLPARHGDFPAILGHTWFIVTSKKTTEQCFYLSIYRYIYIILYTLHVSRFLTFFLAGGACNKHVQINGRRSLEASVASYGAATGGFWQGAVALRTRMPLGLWGQGGMKNMGMPHARVKIVDIWVWYFP